MSDASYSLLKKQGIDVAATAPATFALASGSVTGSYNQAAAQSVQAAASGGTFAYTLAPVVTVPYGETEQSVDCPKWRDALEAAGAIYTPVGGRVHA